MKRLRLLKGASGSFGPVEKESLGLPLPLGLAFETGQLRLPQLPVRLTPRAGVARFKVRFRASTKKESLGLPQPLGLALEKGPLRLPQLPLRLTPRAGLARFKVRRFAAPKDGLARFEGFEAFEAFEAFEGSIRQFRASRKRKPWLATAAGFGTRKGTTSLATASSSAYSKSRFGQGWLSVTALYTNQKPELPPVALLDGPLQVLTASSSAYSKSRFGTFQGPSFRSSKSRFGTFRGV